LSQRLIRRTLPRVVLGTKAETLSALAPLVTAAKILPLFTITRGRWSADRDLTLLAFAQQPWAHAALIVRSSAQGEDAAGNSLAGRYRSLLNVCGLQALGPAIDAVFATYPDEADDHQVLVQPMLRDVMRSGVAFSRDPNTGGPYRVLNFCEGSDTEALTGGASANHRTLLFTRTAGDVSHATGARIDALFSELEELTGLDSLDIEFAEDRAGDLYLLQARHLSISTLSAVSDTVHARMVGDVERSLTERMKPHPYLFGRRTVFGVMPDWNPAEIVGTRPRPLALSLYRELVTDSIWAYQRHNYGYRNLRSFPLLCDFYGMPYIDVRVSFNSFLPDDLPENLAERLADHYIDALCRRPALHDKVEFEIIYSCYTLDLPDRLEALAEAGFSAHDREQVAESLRGLTNRIINARNGLWLRDIEKLETLSRRYEIIAAQTDDPVSQIYWLLEDCKRYGTLPFAGLARAGFIAVQLLRSLVATGVLCEEDYQCFLGSLSTVSGEIGRDFAAMGRPAFLDRYGHLRPGTYDIRSPRYDAAPDLYFDWSSDRMDASVHARPRFALTLEQMNAISALLVQHRLDHDVIGLFNFLKAGIEGRERAKFVFTRNLSLALERLADLGAAHGFSREDMSYCSIAAIYTLHGSCDDPAYVIGRSIEEGRRRHERTLALALPSLIVRPQDARYMEIPATEPNFVTQKAVTAGVMAPDPGADLAGAIVLIRSADPGYDWLFSRGIAGLVTAYGGVNSHMAIRSGELQIPAVIGAGEALFERAAAASTVHIDCANRSLTVLS
jgi:phosphohistidine swiveling domain-containing protein